MGLGPKCDPFGVPLFRTCGPLGPFGRVGFAQKRFWRGSKNGPQNGSENGFGNGAILVSILAPFRDLVANLPFLLKTHGAYTRALILRARALKIHYFWCSFSAPFLVPFWVPKMEAKWEPKWVLTKFPTPKSQEFYAYVNLRVKKFTREEFFGFYVLHET